MVAFSSATKRSVRLVLASGSPRRRELMERFGMPFEVVVSRIDEVPHHEEDPAEFALRMACEKGSEVAQRSRAAIVLAADTVVSIDGRILGKPVDLEAAERMLESLSGRVHSVFTGIALVATLDSPMLTAVDETRVWFRPLETREIREYVRVESVLDKAGAYAIQGVASEFIPRISGNYSNVVGLPLPVVFDLMRRCSIVADDR